MKLNLRCCCFLINKSFCSCFLYHSNIERFCLRVFCHSGPPLRADCVKTKGDFNRLLISFWRMHAILTFRFSREQFDILFQLWWKSRISWRKKRGPLNKMTFTLKCAPWDPQAQSPWHLIKVPSSVMVIQALIQRKFKQFSTTPWAS